MIQSGGTILAVQDTTSLNYNTHEKMEGIGYISEKTLGVNPQLFCAYSRRIGAWDIGTNIVRPYAGKGGLKSDGSRSHQSKKTRSLEEKESYRWVQTLLESTSNLPDGIHVVTVCDREGDMYALFDEADRWGQAFLIRIAQNRITTENHKILDKIREKQCMGKVKTNNWVFT